MNRRVYAWLALSLLVVGIDQLTKWLALNHIQMGEAVPITSFFQLVLLFNPGAAFSFLSDQPGWQRWLFTGLAAAICIWLFSMLRKHQHERLLPTAFSLIMGGAIGNVIDRLAHGAVVDFLYFHIGRYGWPAFNGADSAITLGVALMLWAHFRPPQNPATAPERSL